MCLTRETSEHRLTSTQTEIDFVQLHSKLFCTVLIGPIRQSLVWRQTAKRIFSKIMHYKVNGKRLYFSLLTHLLRNCGVQQRVWNICRFRVTLGHKSSRKMIFYALRANIPHDCSSSIFFQIQDQLILILYNMRKNQKCFTAVRKTILLRTASTGYIISHFYFKAINFLLPMT